MLDEDVNEITDSICGYLTCEKYWERYDDQVALNLKLDLVVEVCVIFSQVFRLVFF